MAMLDSGPPVDDRILRYIETTERLQRGEYGIEVGVGGGDAVGRLGECLGALSKSLERQYQEFVRLSGMAARINAGLLLDDVLDGVYRDFREIIPYDRLGCALLEQDNQVLRARWARSTQSRVLLDRGYGATMAGSSLEDILRTGRPRIINDLFAYLEVKPHSAATRLLVDEGYRSSLTCPLIANGVPCGFLFFTSVAPGTYASAHVDTFQRIAGQLSVIVEKARLVSELADQKHRIEEQNQRLLQLNEEKNRFLGIAAHDLRNPIGAIGSVAELLLSPEDDVSPEEQRSFLEDIAGQAGYMLRLLDDLLDVSHIESGKLVLNPVEFDPATLLGQAVERHARVAAAKGSRVVLDPARSATVAGDPVRLRQVVDNLISNAVKYSPPGATVRVEAGEEEQGWLVVVRDEGPGLTAADHARLFQDFARLSARPTGGEASTGLGLAISRRIVECHGGRIGARPAPGRGTEFWFTIPRAPLGPPTPQADGRREG
jgi:signal transduction histidine kinase